MVEVTSDFILQVLGAKEVELAALRIQHALLEREHAALLAAQPSPPGNVPVASTDTPL